MTYSHLTRMAFGYADTQILYAAVRIGVPDALTAGPLPVDDLARTLHADPGALTRLIRALVVLGVVEQVQPGRIALTPLGRPLCAGHPQSLRAGLLLLGDPVTWQAWASLTQGVRTGTAAFEHAHGRPLFDYLAGDRELAGVFNTAMGEGTGWVAAEVAKAYDFAAARTVVDIGGGNGTLLAAVLVAAPGAHGILADTAEGAAGAAETLRQHVPQERWSVEAGDFFDAVPPGDVLMLKGILHDWDDRRCVTLLRNCRRSIAPDGRLLVLEPVLPDRWDDPAGASVVMSDIAMLVLTGGRERTRDDFRNLLAAGGFVLKHLTPPLSGSPTRILVADPD